MANKQHYIYPRIDRNISSSRLVDLNSFLEITFPNNTLHQDIASAIIEYLIINKEGYLIKDIIPYIKDKKKITHTKLSHNPKGVGEVIVSKDTIGKIFKSMWQSGLINRQRRYAPVSLSNIFSIKLRDLSNYWENYIKKYG